MPLRAFRLKNFSLKRIRKRGEVYAIPNDRSAHLSPEVSRELQLLSIPF